MSARGSICPPSKRSGAMYANVPRVLPAVVKPSSPAVRARPKSIRYTNSPVGDQDVRRLDVAVDQARFVCGIQGRRDLLDHVTANAGAERLLAAPASMVPRLRPSISRMSR